MYCSRAWETFCKLYKPISQALPSFHKHVYRNAKLNMFILNVAKKNMCTYIYTPTYTYRNLDKSRSFYDHFHRMLYSSIGTRKDLVFICFTINFCCILNLTSTSTVLIWKNFLYERESENLLLLSPTLHSVQFSRSVVSDSLWPHDLQNTRPPCPSPTPGVYSNSCPSSRWCHPAISSSVVPFSSCPQSLPASGSFPVSQLFSWGGQSTGVSASASVLPVNTQDWFPLGWTGWISLQSKGLSRVFSNTTVQKHQFLALSFLYSPTLTFIHDHWKNHTLN